MLKEELFGKPVGAIQTTRVQTSYRNPNDSQLGNSQYPNDDDGFNSEIDEEERENEEEEVMVEDSAEGDQRQEEQKKEEEGDIANEDNPDQ